MAKPMAAPAVLRTAAELGFVPSSASVSRKGEARWEGRGLAHLGWLSKSPEGALTWYVNVGDAKFGPAMDKYGGMSVPIRSSRTPIPWPTGTDDSLVEFLRSGLGAAAYFVADRIDLCSILSAREDVVRGDLHAWLPVANYPARLVQALILARDLGLSDMQDRIREDLNQDPIRLSNGRLLEILPSAKGWAAKYSVALGFPVGI